MAPRARNRDHLRPAPVAEVQPGARSAIDELRARRAEIVELHADPFSGEAIDGLTNLLDDAHAALAAVLERLGKLDWSARRGPEEPRLGSLAVEADQLRQLIAELADDGALAWLRTAGRIEAAADRLAEAGPPSEIVARAPLEAARVARLDRVVLSRIVDGMLIAEGVHCQPGAGDGSALIVQLEQVPVRLEYPMVEAELVRRRQAQIVAGNDPGISRRAFAEVMGWTDYVAAPVVLGGRTGGFLHGDRAGSDAEPPGALERDALKRFAEAFAGAFERAVLRQRLRTQRQELRRVASWADARTGELSDAAIDLAAIHDMPAPEEAVQAPSTQVRGLLTKREIEVVEQMVKGASNAEIARALVVAESTVKFHVKNILRKLNASNRAEATSRYIRLAMRSDRP